MTTLPPYLQLQNDINLKNLFSTPRLGSCNMGTSTYSEWEATHHVDVDPDHDKNVDFSQFNWNSKNLAEKDVKVYEKENEEPDLSMQKKLAKSLSPTKWNNFLREVQKISIEIDDTNEEFM